MRRHPAFSELRDGVAQHVVLRPGSSITSYRRQAVEPCRVPVGKRLASDFIGNVECHPIPCTLRRREQVWPADSFPPFHDPNMRETALLAILPQARTFGQLIVCVPAACL
jgi:hypothetical protein